MSRHLCLLVATLVAATGCVPAPTGTKPAATATRKPGGITPAGKEPQARPPAAGGTAPAAGSAAAPRLPEGLLTRSVTQTGELTQLTGKVKLISDHGASLISNNGGGLVSDAGGGLVSDAGGGLIANNGGGIIANNSGGLVGKSKYRVTQTDQAPESTLVDATVYVQDAAGRALVDAQGKPLAAVSDGQGGYKLQATLPAENLVLKVRLWNGGELSAILPKAEAKQREVAIDTAATLGASYVLSQFVKGDQATFDKLPASEADRLRRDLAAVRGLIGRTPDYQAEGLVKLTDELRAKDPTVDKTLTDIKALLLGQANLGGGRKAIEVPLADPRAIVPDGSGFMISEGSLGRIRRVAADGTITTYIDQLHGEIKANFFGAVDLARGADGSLYVLSGKTFGITRVKPDGTVQDLAGTGRPGRGEFGKPGPEVALRPWSMWLDPDGTAWIGEDANEGQPPRILALGTDGILREPAPPAWGLHRVVGLARASGDGALYALLVADDNQCQLWRLATGASSWTQVNAFITGEKQADLAPAADGGLIVSEGDGGRLLHLALDGSAKVILDAAKGSPIKRPTDISVLPDGRMRVIDGGSIRVFEVALDGTATPVAGTGQQAGDASGDAIALNGPFAAAVTPAGQLYLTETGGHALKRWDGKELVPVAGGVKGYSGDGGPAGAAALDTPAGLAVKGDDVLLVDQANHVIRAVGPDGKIRTLVGGPGAAPGLAKGIKVGGATHRVSDGGHLAIGPDGSVYWTELQEHAIARLAPDGQVSLVAGTTKGSAGDGGPALDAKFNTPVGLALGPDGALYVADAANMRIRRIKDPTGDNPTVEAFAGLDSLAAFGRLAEPAGAAEQASEAAFAFPGALCFDQAGNLYVAEFGTLSLPLLMGLASGMRDMPLELLPKVPARIRKITPAGVVSVVAGPGGKFFGDPEAGDALVLPTGLAIDDKGRLVIVDAGANLIRFLPAGAY